MTEVTLYFSASRRHVKSSEYQIFDAATDIESVTSTRVEKKERRFGNLSSNLM